MLFATTFAQYRAISGFTDLTANVVEKSKEILMKTLTAALVGTAIALTALPAPALAQPEPVQSAAKCDFTRSMWSATNQTCRLVQHVSYTLSGDKLAPRVGPGQVSRQIMCWVDAQGSGVNWWI
ncbi:hypothetical protein D9V34_03030 [Mycetocola lacteus]|uniref:Uncharacterized protein n=1 Tax=Mycetocola lacteus TaxID=76637 RepID=A0A3L7ATE9_9MICO|nr:hypothetical protein D9V34_03030 [Mycetocola lacteus]